MPEGSYRSVDREEWGELPIRGREAELKVGEAQGRAEGEVGLLGKEDLLRAEVETERVFLAGGGVSRAASPRLRRGRSAAVSSAW